jgi:hypothetical protein
VPPPPRTAAPRRRRGIDHKTPSDDSTMAGPSTKSRAASSAPNHKNKPLRSSRTSPSLLSTRSPATAWLALLLLFAALALVVLIQPPRFLCDRGLPMLCRGAAASAQGAASSRPGMLARIGSTVAPRTRSSLRSLLAVGGSASNTAAPSASALAQPAAAAQTLSAASALAAASARNATLAASARSRRSLAAASAGDASMATTTTTTAVAEPASATAGTGEPFSTPETNPLLAVRFSTADVVCP